MTVSKRFRVVIIGAGFGGLQVARSLAHSSVEVLLLDRNNYHVSLPLLHQVAAAELEPELLAYPIRSLLRNLPNVQFTVAVVRRVDLTKQFIETDNCLIYFDFLVLATGSTSEFSGVSGAAEYTFPLKTLEQAVAVRNHILACFEQANQELDAQRRQELLTFVVTGGGPTGVEFAGALAELVHGSLVKDYPNLDWRRVNIVLLHSGNNLLSRMPQHLCTYTQARLRQLGVKVYLHTRVSQVSCEAVQLHDGRVIPAKTIVWTAGVRGNSPTQLGEVPLTSNGQIAVIPTLQVARHPNLYVIGDLAAVDKSGQLPMLATVAMQQGQAVGRNITRQVRGQNPLPFRYQHRGTMAIIGRHAAVAHIGRLTFTGFPAWMLWLGVHLVTLRGFRNRLLVLVNWFWDYLFHDRGVRLLLPSIKGTKTQVRWDPSESNQALIRQAQFERSQQMLKPYRSEE